LGENIYFPSLSIKLTYIFPYRPFLSFFFPFFHSSYFPPKFHNYIFPWVGGGKWKIYIPGFTYINLVKVDTIVFVLPMEKNKKNEKKVNLIYNMVKEKTFEINISFVTMKQLFPPIFIHYSIAKVLASYRQCRITKMFSFLLFEHWKTFWTIPLALGFCGQTHAAEMEPFDGTILVITSNHLTIRNLLA